MQRLQRPTGKIFKFLKNWTNFPGPKILVNIMEFQTVQNKKILEVFVDKGMREGHTVTFNGEADQEFGKDPGDVQIGTAL